MFAYICHMSNSRSVCHTFGSAALGLLCALSLWACKEPGVEMPQVNEALPAPATEVLKVLRNGHSLGLKEALTGKAKLAGTHRLHDERAAKVEGAAALNLKFGRTSNRIRNQANKAPAWAVRVLAGHGSEKTYLMEKKFYTFDVGNGRRGYLEALEMSLECIRCHGRESDLAPGMKARLDAEFPEDEATGYKGSELRGWFWLEYDATK